MSSRLRRSDLRGLYAITPDWPDTGRLLAASEAILAAGCRLLQYRHKTAPDALRVEQIRALRALTRRFGARLIINDDIDLALAGGADGVHLGRDDGALAAARRRLPPGMLLGASCYQDIDAARAALDVGADYVAFGRFFPSTSKPLANQAHPDLLREARRALDGPICAIGGVTVDNGGPLIAAGADLLAVIAALYEAADPGLEARRLINLFAVESAS